MVYVPERTPSPPGPPVPSNPVPPSPEKEAHTPAQETVNDFKVGLVPTVERSAPKSLAKRRVTIVSKGAPVEQNITRTTFQVLGMPDSSEDESSTPPSSPTHEDDKHLSPSNFEEFTDLRETIAANVSPLLTLSLRSQQLKNNMDDLLEKLHREGLTEDDKERLKEEQLGLQLELSELMSRPEADDAINLSIHPVLSFEFPSEDH
ncbi:MAG: hypothetical protein S4CHLAM37_02900 [Chlamydiia bacterium]|nr:hypothetical protein [Chlamydiia bacterium]